MEDKMLMEGLLWDTKVLADLCLHVTIESSSANVHEMFLTGLKEVLHMQHEIYQMMSDMGWYTTTDVEQTKIDKVIQKFQTFVEQEGK